MSTASLSIFYEQDIGTIELKGPIDETLALGIDRALTRLFGYFQYEHVVIRICSPGGDLNALSHILECIAHWRREGRQVHTQAMFQAASASAMLLALGQVGSRTVQRHTSVLFHHARLTASTAAITAGRAGQLAQILRRSDDGMVMRLVMHLGHGLGGVDGVSGEGLARCEMLRGDAEAVAMAVGTRTPARDTRRLKTIVAMYRNCGAQVSLAPYQRHLEKRFDQDMPMAVPEAFLLNLIDCVAGVPRFGLQHAPSQLQPRAATVVARHKGNPLRATTDESNAISRMTEDAGRARLHRNGSPNLKA